MPSLFAPVVPEDKLHPSFKVLRDAFEGHPGRAMMEDIFRDFVDVDGTFVKEFQTTGFDARFFELYVHAFLTREGYTLDRSKSAPDFLVEKGGIRTAIEVTTVNPATSGPLKDGRKIADLMFAERRDYERHELAIRFGSPLLSKLRKRYWELPHCKDLPFVLFIEAFHDEHSLAFSDNALTSYLFGIEQTGTWSEDGSLQTTTHSLSEHSIGGKSIPSNFFQQPDTEHISAVVFSNSGTSAKFSRMGFQHGHGNCSYRLTRFGLCFTPDPNAMDPTYFHYDVGNPPFIESWGQGLVVNHNPNAKIPLPDEYFGAAVDAHYSNHQLVSNIHGWHPLSSKTTVIHFPKPIPTPLLIQPAIAVTPIHKQDFYELAGDPNNDAPFIEEQGWFADETTSFLGRVVFYKNDNDWAYAILARDPRFIFHVIETRGGFDARREACQDLQRRICSLLLQPKRFFERIEPSADSSSLV